MENPGKPSLCMPSAKVNRVHRRSSEVFDNFSYLIFGRTLCDAENPTSSAGLLAMHAPVHQHTPGYHGHWLGALLHTHANTAQRGSIPIPYAMFYDPHILSLICITTLPWLNYSCHDKSALGAICAALFAIASLLTPILGLLCLMYCFTVVQAPDPNQRADYDVLPGMRRWDGIPTHDFTLV